jgi:membrane protease YdiL (CAAX protease family)
VQQLYFHGHLMPRLPVAAAQAGWLLAPVTSAALIAAQHLWQPQLVVFIFAAQALLGLLVWRTGCLAVAVLVHSAGNLLAIMTTLVLVLAG